jgi:hypothetical protein
MDPICRFPIVIPSPPGNISLSTLDAVCLLATLLKLAADVAVDFENWLRLNGGRVTSLPPVARLILSIADSIGLIRIKPMAQAKLRVKDW